MADPKYGRTVEDALRFLRRPRVSVMLAVRVTVQDVRYLSLSKTSVGQALRRLGAQDLLPSAYDPAANELVIGALSAVSAAAEAGHG